MSKWSSRLLTISLGSWKHLSALLSCLPAQRGEYPEDKWSCYSSVHNVGLGILSLFTKVLSSVHPLWCYCMLSSSVVPSISCSPCGFQQLTMLECVKHTTADSHLTPIARLPAVLNCAGRCNMATCTGLSLCVKGTSQFCTVAFLLLLPMSFLLSPLICLQPLSLGPNIVCGGKDTSAFRIPAFYCWYANTVCKRQALWERKMPQFILPWRIEFHCI